MKTLRLQDITLPCWIYDKDLQTELGCNESAMYWGDILTDIELERDFLIQGLQKEGLVYFGEPKTFIAYRVRESVYIQCLADLAIQSELKESEDLDKSIEKERQAHIQTKKELWQHSAKLNAIFDSTALFIWTLDLDGVLTSSNRRFEEKMCEWFERVMVVGEVMLEEPFPENITQWNHYQQQAKNCITGEKGTVQLKLYTVDQEYVWVEVFMDPIRDITSNKITEISCIGFEITEEKKRSEQISQSLKEKETLLKEVHHRVKNNLQIISSLLSLQAAVIKDERVIDMLKESQNRVRSMSYIHESLYSNNDFHSVALKDYLRGLCSSLVQSYSISGSKVDIQLRVDDIHLELDQAIPCGLILNELISNALKHAYQEGENGQVRIDIREKEGRMAILVEDDGHGMPEDWNIEDADSLGIQLVYTLTEQLDGEIELSTIKGTKYLITFERIKTSK